VVLRISEPGFSNGRCEVSGIFSTVSNQTLRRESHLVGRRFWSEEIEDDNYFMTAVRYRDRQGHGRCLAPVVPVWDRSPAG